MAAPLQTQSADVEVYSEAIRVRVRSKQEYWLSFGSNFLLVGFWAGPVQRPLAAQYIAVQYILLYYTPRIALRALRRSWSWCCRDTGGPLSNQPSRFRRRSSPKCSTWTFAPMSGAGMLSDTPSCQTGQSSGIEPPTTVVVTSDTQFRCAQVPKNFREGHQQAAPGTERAPFGLPGNLRGKCPSQPAAQFGHPSAQLLRVLRWTEGCQ